MEAETQSLEIGATGRRRPWRGHRLFFPCCLRHSLVWGSVRDVPDSCVIWEQHTLSCSGPWKKSFVMRVGPVNFMVAGGTWCSSLRSLFPESQWKERLDFLCRHGGADAVLGKPS